MRVLLLVSLLLFAARPTWASTDPPPEGCAAVEPLTAYFDGMVEAMGPARWQLAGQSVGVDASTTILPPGLPPTVGDWASVTAQWRLDGSLVATRIVTSASPPAEAPIVRFIGLAEAVGSGQWIVSGVRVRVTPATVVVGQPAVGGLAFVQARQLDTVIDALLMVVAPPGVEPVFLDGVLQTVDGDLWSVMVGAAPVAVTVDSGAYVQGSPAVGRRVQLMAVERTGLPAQALYAAVTPSIDERVYFGGRLVTQIAATSPEQWLLLVPSDDGPWLELRTTTVDRMTVPIDETAGPASSGAWLEVTAIAPLWPGEPWTAWSLRVAQGPQASVQGVVSEIRNGLPARWQVGDVCVIVDGQAAVDGRPRVDRHALVQGTRLGRAVVWAQSAAVRYRLEGTLVARLTHVTPQTWVILVTPPSIVDGLPSARVYLGIDAISRIDPSLLPGVLGVDVAVQARAGPSGWLVDWVDDPASPWQP